MREIKIWRFSIITLLIMFLFSELFTLYCEKHMQNVSVSIDGFEKLALLVLSLSSVIFYAKFKEPVINIKSFIKKLKNN